MIQQSPRCSNEDVYPFCEPFCLSLSTRPSHDEAVSERVVLYQFLHHPECLHREFSGRGDDQNPGALLWGELLLVEALDGRHQKGQGFAAARLS